MELIMPYECRPARSGEGFPIRHLNTAAGVTQLAGAPGISQTYYITGYFMGGAGDEDGFTILRRNCIELSETADYITVTSAAGLVPDLVDFSVAIWVKIPTTITTIPQLFHKDDGSNKGVIIELAAGKAKVTIGDGTDTASVTSNDVINDNDWHLIVAACDRNVTTGLYLYVDDRAVVATTDTVTDVGTINNVTNITIYGVSTYDWYLGPAAYYEGSDGLLSAANVATLYNKGIGTKFEGTETGLSWAINCDEGIGTTTYDVLGNSN